MTQKEKLRDALNNLEKQAKGKEISKNDPLYKISKTLLTECYNNETEFFFALAKNGKAIQLLTFPIDYQICAMANFIYAASRHNDKNLSWDEIIAKIQLEVMQREEDENEKN